MAAASREAVPSTEALVWAAGAGISGATGLAVFFRAMTRGNMSLVAPVGALVAASVPALIGVMRGEALEALQMVGIVLALVAVAVISRPAPDASSSASRSDGVASAHVLPLAMLAGLGFAGFYVGIDHSRVAGAAQWWPIVAARAAGATMVLAWALATRTIPRASIRAAPVLVAAALGDLGGILLFSLAIASGPLSVAAVLSSLYPVTTVLLAWLLLRERLGRAHGAAVVLALVAVALIAA